MIHGFSCKDITERASDFVSHRMSRWDRIKYRVHLFICHDCQRFIAQFRATLASLHRRAQTPADTNVDDQVAFLLKTQRALRDEQKDRDPL